ncbi:Caffeate O-methyltransferase [Handroanthus impetiginosus]|uniref:Caffeate O-methyltransferase n=1 Tax=Handroanthus impetiginosus TaxID=429701 RepID=A0A2G9H839_9LAMI|nr:Caffeate O-methyltransferase [Handroanthus impetiginosus]
MDNKPDEEACLFAMHLTTSSVLPMILKTAIELDLLELIKKTGAKATASAAELAAQLPRNNPDGADIIDRILRLMVAHSVLVCGLKLLPDGGFFARNEDGLSVGTPCLKIQDGAWMEPW